MQPDKVKALIETKFPDAIVKVQGDGSHFEALVITDAFKGESPLARQRKVYASVQEEISNGTIHALSIKARTPDEWQNNS